MTSKMLHSMCDALLTVETALGMKSELETKPKRFGKYLGLECLHHDRNDPMPPDNSWATLATTHQSFKKSRMTQHRLALGLSRGCSSVRLITVKSFKFSIELVVVVTMKI